MDFFTPQKYPNFLQHPISICLEICGALAVFPSQGLTHQPLVKRLLRSTTGCLRATNHCETPRIADLQNQVNTLQLVLKFDHIWNHKNKTLATMCSHAGPCQCIWTYAADCAYSVGLVEGCWDGSGCKIPFWQPGAGMPTPIWRAFVSRPQRATIKC